MVGTLLILVHLLLSPPAPIRAKIWDLSTDEKLESAVREATGHGIYEKSCVVRLSGVFKSVVLIGSWADDAGCVSEGYFADGHYVKDRNAAAKALVSAGWSDRTKRKELALAWASNALGETQFASNPPPVTRLEPDGGVVVEGWRHLRGGMIPQTIDNKVRVKFSPSGDATETVIESIVTEN